MKKIDYAIITILIFIAFSCILIGIIGNNYPRIQFIEKDVVREIEVNNCVCMPCIEAPIPDCMFKSFAYKAVVNKYDEWGNLMLKKDDIYILISRPYLAEWDYFCSHLYQENPNPMSRCYRQKEILDKSLFKAIN